MLFFYDLYGNKQSSSEEQLHSLFYGLQSTLSITLGFKCSHCQWCISLNGISLLNSLYYSFQSTMLSLFFRFPQTEDISSVSSFLLPIKSNGVGHLNDQTKTFNMAEILKGFRGKTTNYYSFVVVVYILMSFTVGDQFSSVQ